MAMAAWTGTPPSRSFVGSRVVITVLRTEYIQSHHFTEIGRCEKGYCMYGYNPRNGVGPSNRFSLLDGVVVEREIEHLRAPGELSAHSNERMYSSAEQVRTDSHSLLSLSILDSTVTVCMVALP